MEAFLTKEERRTIQRMYKHWLDYLRPEEFIIQLYTRDLIRLRERQQLDAKPTAYKKNECLFEIALQRITYDHLKKVREVLVQTEQVELARMLPVRYPDDYWQRYDRQQAQMRQQEQARMQQNQRGHGGPGNQGRSISPMDTTDHQHHGPAQEQKVNSANDPPQRNISNPNFSTMPAARSEPPTNPNHLPSYKRKVNNSTGKGYCLIIANYTNDLTGYNKDVTNLKEFFRDVLGYTVREKKDVKRAEMMCILKETANELIITENNYDRLFVFVLSHGEKEGIQTCKEDGKSDEWIGQIKQHVTPEEVISLFTHNNLPTLRNFPKVFFFQMCRGKGIAQAAGGSAGESADQTMSTEDMECDLAQCAANPDKIAIAADTLVCFASPPGYYSWVDKQKGSWLIQITLEVFKEYYQSEHLIDMITQVNKLVTSKTQPAQVRDQVQHVYQVPCIKHNLTQKFYLQDN